MDNARAIRDAATALGFASCGFSAVEPLPRERFLRDWLAEGRAAEMVYLWRRMSGRIDPRRLAPGLRSVISLAYPYPPPPPPATDWRADLRGRIAAYARGRDYHDVVGDLLQQLASLIRGLAPGAEARPYVDTGPVLEREWGHRAGLGWFGKNTMLLEQRAGSWFFLAEILTNLDLPVTNPPADHCGACRRCLDVCPTQALADGYRLDPRRCISYLTIEHRGQIPRELRPQLGNWIFGCDLCQDVCPWNGEGGTARDFELLNPPLAEILRLDAVRFRARYAGTAVLRTKRRGLLRNAAVALGNSGNREAVPPLAGAMTDPEPVVRSHAAWALGHLGGTAAVRALETARKSTAESDSIVQEEIEAALAAGC